jgi:hypothetical protein
VQNGGSTAHDDGGKFADSGRFASANWDDGVPRERSNFCGATSSSVLQVQLRAAQKPKNRLTPPLREIILSAFVDTNELIASD